ncbi:hypothetical protein A2U01_0042545 [Trifolium medium]|uniref:Uncharacterized protein n=1 Tax=Trifolium medium TaxID=97028 RepID=A0A392QC12_9FABA|nr:hypothetical protein [Trifolium medium]
MMRLNLVSSAGDAVADLGETTASAGGSVGSFFPSNPPSPKKLLTDDGSPR